MGTRTVNSPQRLCRLFRAKARRIADHHLGQPDDGIERGAQLMAHAGERMLGKLARRFSPHHQHANEGFRTEQRHDQPRSVSGPQQDLQDWRRRFVLEVGGLRRGFLRGRFRDRLFAEIDALSVELGD